MRAYTLHRDQTGAWCTLHEEIDGNKTVSILDPRISQRVRNHSPEGFEFGYGGSGPAQLALGILIDYFGHLQIEQRPRRALAKDIAVDYYQQFKQQFIAGAQEERTITDEQISEFVKQQLQPAPTK